ncbi:D(2)-like dopamine receptor [Anneissia japonica]|uniref:D(2)-like dopamine receptor n=1 Tax=Anneissia japonica TaxID=1529436 RepID=UPI001425AAB0|nr:D(2)-like dopamine receptor [Anneissia japonica]XP_033126951.1 D(2)-like dopamine receptor [Anneissia japonica]
MPSELAMEIFIGNVDKGRYWNASENETREQSEVVYNWPMLSLCTIIFLSVLGNMLVCLSIMKHKKLQNITNYFLFSLAIADLMVAVLVMPLGVVNNFMGYWSMGLVLCNIWVSLDVLCCTSSILHMCCLFVDRYLAIQNPLKYSVKRKTLRKTLTKITILWIMSTMISLPLFIVGLVDPTKVLHDGVCAPMKKAFVIYGSVLAFFIPLLIVVITYSLTTLILRKKVLSAQPSKNNNTNAIFRVLTDVETKSKTIVGNTVHMKKIMHGGNKNVTLSRNNSMDYAIQTSSLQINDTTEMKSLITCSKYDSRRRSKGSPYNMYAMLRKNSKRYNEKRAEKVLGIIFVSFVVGWSPFFITNVINATCNLCISNNMLFILFTWLGWSSSMVNPIIYTIFSKDFQNAFRNLLCWKVGSGKEIQLPDRELETYNKSSVVKKKSNSSQESQV